MGRSCHKINWPMCRVLSFSGQLSKVLEVARLTCPLQGPFRKCAWRDLGLDASFNAKGVGSPIGGGASVVVSSR